MHDLEAASAILFLVGICFLSRALNVFGLVCSCGQFVGLLEAGSHGASYVVRHYKVFTRLRLHLTVERRIELSRATQIVQVLLEVSEHLVLPKWHIVTRLFVD